MPTIGPGSKQPLPSRNVPGISGLAQDFERTYSSSRRKLIYKYFDLHVLIKGKVSAKLEKGTPRSRLKLDLEQQKGAVELTVGEILSGYIEGKVVIEQSPNRYLEPGAPGGLAPHTGLSRQPQIGGSTESVSIKVGHQYLAFQIRANPLSPVAIASALKATPFDKTIAQLGLRVKGEVQLELNVELWPNYLALASAPGFRKLVAKGAIHFLNNVRPPIWAGRAAIANTFRFGGKIVGYVPTILRAAGRGAAAASRSVGRGLAVAVRTLPTVLRALNMAMWIADAAVFPFRVLLDARSARKQGLERALLEHYRNGYAQELSILTASNWKQWFHAHAGGPSWERRAWRISPPSGEDEFERWLESDAADVELRRHDLLRVDPGERWAESLRVFVATSLQTPHMLEVRKTAADQADLAGRAAALQDVFGFVVSASSQDAVASDGTYIGASGLDAWNGVAEYHRRWYGRARNDRYVVQGGIYPGYVGIPPFWSE